MKYNITPIPKPRMTRSDSWKKRPCVMRYWDFKDQVREAGVKIPEDGYLITFVLPMPKSWSKKKKAEMFGTPHKQTPDKDNLEKALLDAVLDEDSHIWIGACQKAWGHEGGIIIDEYQFLPLKYFEI